MTSLIRIVLKRAGWVVAVGSVLAALSTYFAAKLYLNLKTDIEELLPTTARSVIDLNEVGNRLVATDSIAVLVWSSYVDGSRRFMDDLARELEQVPSDTIAGIEYRIDRELKFFHERQALFVDLKDLQRIRDYISRRIDYETQLYNPLNIFRSDELKKPVLQVGNLLKKYKGKTKNYTQFPGGYYATPDEKLRILFAYLPGKASGIGAALKLRGAIDQAIEKLGPQNYARDIEIKFSGNVQNLIEEHHSLIADLELSTVIVLFLVTLVMVGYFRRFWPTMALLASLIYGTLWTFGVAFFAVGYLNANSAFLGAIVIGNGINFGIILLARYLEERRKGRIHSRAVFLAMQGTATATWTAALAAGLAYGSLMMTEFRGFSQFGVIGLIGMVLCWISAFTILPALLTLLHQFGGVRKFSKRRSSNRLATLIALGVGSFPGTIRVATVLFCLLAAYGFSTHQGEIIETNLGKLRDKRSMESGSGYLSHYLDQIFNRYLDPIVVLPRNKAESEKIRLALLEEKNREGSLIANVTSLKDFIPKQQTEKIEVFRQIKKLLTPRVRQNMKDEDREMLDTYLNDTVFQTFDGKDLPPLIQARFTEQDGGFGRMILVEPPLDNSTWNGKNLVRFVENLRQTTDQAAEGSPPIVGQLPVTADMFEAIHRDGPKATLFAFLAVVVMVVLLFLNFLFLFFRFFLLLPI